MVGHGILSSPRTCDWSVGYSDGILNSCILLSFPAKKYKKVTGKEIYSDTLESTPMLEKEKFPQDYFPEVCEEWCLLISTLIMRMSELDVV